MCRRMLPVVLVVLALLASSTVFAASAPAGRPSSDDAFLSTLQSESGDAAQELPGLNRTPFLKHGTNCSFVGSAGAPADRRAPRCAGVDMTGAGIAVVRTTVVVEARPAPGLLLGNDEGRRGLCRIHRLISEDLGHQALTGIASGRVDRFGGEKRRGDEEDKQQTGEKKQLPGHDVSFLKRPEEAVLTGRIPGSPCGRFLSGNPAALRTIRRAPRTFPTAPDSSSGLQHILTNRG